MSSMNGVSAYQQTSQVWTSNTKKSTESKTAAKADSEIKVSEWKPIDTSSSLVPAKVDGIGMSVGNVQLSDKAKDYYAQLKEKFGNMDFILVSKDMKSKVAANAAAYGNASKPVVLIDDEKIERMANDEAFRKKYEGLIAMSQQKLAAAKNSLASSGANVKNFGMSISEDGSIKYFATLEKSTAEQTKRIEKKQAEKQAAKAKEKKAAEKKAREDSIEKSREDKLGDNQKLSANDDAEIEKEYVTFEADSIEALLNHVAKYAYNNSASNVMTEAEKNVGQQIDFKG